MEQKRDDGCERCHWTRKRRDPILLREEPCPCQDAAADDWEKCYGTGDPVKREGL